MDERKTDNFSLPRNKSINKAKIKREMTIRILTGFNCYVPYMA